MCELWKIEWNVGKYGVKEDIWAWKRGSNRRPEETA